MNDFLETKKIKYAIGLVVIPILIANLHVATFYFLLHFVLAIYCRIYIIHFAYANVIISGAKVDSIRKKIQKQGETEELLEKLQKAEEKHKRLKRKRR